MHILQKFKSTAARFGHDKKGNFAILAGVIIPVVLVAGGFAVDVAQINTTKSHLLNALDAAVTSTARDITTGKIETKDARASVEKFLFANGVTGFADADRISLDNLVINKTARTVEASASVKIDLAFPVFNISKEQKISTQSAAVYSDRTIEVSMMLDVTGSMGGQKIKDLKTAAKNAARLFLEGQDAQNPRVRVAVVPYADAVNTGVLKNTVFVEKKGGSNIPPRLEDPIEAATAPDNCATERKDNSGNGPAINDVSPYVAMVNRDDRLAFCPSAALRPLTADRDAVNATIDSFSANGYTAGHIGIQWAWYMLSPNWKKVMTAESEPASYNTKKAAKYAILMTDGEFNTAFAGVREGDNTRGSQGFKSRDTAELLCSAMKKKGIEIFTIGFMLNNESAKGVLRKCASNDTGSIQHFYDTADGDALNTAFEKIAANIEKLAITK